MPLRLPQPHPADYCSSSDSSSNNASSSSSGVHCWRMQLPLGYYPTHRTAAFRQSTYSCTTYKRHGTVNHPHLCFCSHLTCCLSFAGGLTLAPSLLLPVMNPAQSSHNVTSSKGLRGKQNPYLATSWAFPSSPCGQLQQMQCMHSSGDVDRQHHLHHVYLQEL